MKKFLSEYNFWIIKISVFAAVKAAMFSDLHNFIGCICICNSFTISIKQNYFKSFKCKNKHFSKHTYSLM